MNVILQRGLSLPIPRSFLASPRGRGGAGHADARINTGSGRAARRAGGRRAVTPPPSTMHARPYV